MIPKFPNFKKLELGDKEYIESFTKNFPPYSDYNFASMWSWDTRRNAKWSDLNGNLVIQFDDYVTQEPFVSFFGTSHINETIELLLDFAQDHKLSKRLRLISEEVIKLTDVAKYKILPDIDSFDYVLSTKLISSLEGKKLYSRRKFVKQFLDRYSHKVDVGPLSVGLRDQIIDCADRWIENKTQTKKAFNHNEREAIHRILNIPASAAQLICVRIHINDNLEGFSILEIVNNEWAIAHFEKENFEFRGIGAFLKQQEGKFLHSRGINYLNLEQDLGIIQLREAKRRYLPINYLKKYTVSLP